MVIIYNMLKMKNMRQIGFYFLFILSFVNRDIWGMKAEEKVNLEKEFNNNYCISDIDSNILNLSDLEELKLYDDKNKKLETLKEQLDKDEINVVEFCTAEENTIKFKVVEEEEIKENVKYFSCIEGDINSSKELCVGIVEDKILITKEGELRNFRNKKIQISKENKLFLSKKPVKESLIFNIAFEAANNAKNEQKTEFELSLLYLTIRQEMQKGLHNLKYEKKIHKFLYNYNKLYYYWDEKKKHIYFFQYYTGRLVLDPRSFKKNQIEALKNEKQCVIYEVQDINQQKPNPNVVYEEQDIKILDLDVEEKKSCCQECCENCI